MSKNRHLMVDLKTGKTNPAMPRDPVLCSSRQAWDGIRLEQHLGGPLEMSESAPVGHVVILQLKHTATTEWKINGNGYQAIQWHPGQISILEHMAPVSLRTVDTGDVIALSIQPKFLFCAAHELINPDHFQLVPQRAIEDPLLRATLLALKAETEAGSPGGSVYAESIASTVAIHLVRHYSAQKPRLPVPKGGLTRYQLNQVLDYVDAHLGENLSLKEMALAVNLSPFHFARLFKTATGVAPHQFLIRRRVERAKELMLSSEESLAEIALKAGFSDQSHLTVIFRKLYGTTPRAFLQQTAPSRTVV